MAKLLEGKIFGESDLLKFHPFRELLAHSETAKAWLDFSTRDIPRGDDPRIAAFRDAIVSDLLGFSGVDEDDKAARESNGKSQV